MNSNIVLSPQERARLEQQGTLEVFNQFAQRLVEIASKGITISSQPAAGIPKVNPDNTVLVVCAFINAASQPSNVKAVLSNNQGFFEGRVIEEPNASKTTKKGVIHEVAMGTANYAYQALMRKYNE